MRSTSSSTFHASSTGTSTRKLSSIFTGPPACSRSRSSGVSTSAGSRCRCSRRHLDDAVSLHEHPRALVAVELRASAQRLRASSTGLPGRRRRWRPRAARRRRRRRRAGGRPRRRRGAGRPARRRRRPTARRASSASSAARRLDAMPSLPVRVVARRSTPVGRRARPGPRGPGSRRRASTGRSPTPTAASSAHATSGRPRHGEQRLRRRRHRGATRGRRRGSRRRCVNRSGPDRRGSGVDPHA